MRIAIAIATLSASTRATRDVQPRPKTLKVFRPGRKPSRVTHIDLMVFVGSSTAFAAATMRGPTTPSAGTATALWSHLEPHETPELTAASRVQ